MKLIIITADTNQAIKAQNAGIDRIMVDLEILGKEARQGHLDSVISHHTTSDVTRLRSVLDSSELMVRINPIFEGSKAEIDEVIARGANRLMLPLFRHPDEVARILDIVSERVPVTLLLETGAALARLPQLCKLGGFDDIHIGLNDLHLELKLDFMFELFVSDLMEFATQTLRNSGIPFGIGGVARLGQGRLPAELILSEHIRLGSSSVILSRSFALEKLHHDKTLNSEVRRIRDFIGKTDLPLNKNRVDLAKLTSEIVADIRATRN